MDGMKPIPNWPGYFATNNGRVFSQRRTEENGRGGNHKSRFLFSSVDKGGYSQVTLWKNKSKKTIKVHRLVALAWVPNLSNAKEVNHINGFRLDNRAENLEWVSPSQNRLHQYQRVVAERDHWKERAQRTEAFLKTKGLWK